MFIDTSAFVAIFCKESEAGLFTTCIERANQRRTSPLVRLETCIVLASRLDRAPVDVQEVDVQEDVDAFLTEAGITVVPIDDEIGRIAVAAFRRFGKGRGHPAQLNLADCMSYACAHARRDPILFKGRPASPRSHRPAPRRPRTWNCLAGPDLPATGSKDAVPILTVQSGVPGHPAITNTPSPSRRMVAGFRNRTMRIDPPPRGIPVSDA